MTDESPNVWALQTSHTGDNNNRMAIAKVISQDKSYLCDCYDIEQSIAANGEPDIFIACEEDSYRHAQALKEATNGKVFVVGLQTPDVDLNEFDSQYWRNFLDMQILYSHHKSSGIQARFKDNPWPQEKPRIAYDYNPSYIDKKLLDKAALEIPEAIREKILGPVYTVCMGSVVYSRASNFPKDEQDRKLLQENIEHMICQVADSAKHNNGSILVTTSRRTGDFCMPLLKELLKGTNHFIYDWNDTKGMQNPYISMLAAASYIIVSGDSISMVSDAMTTGKPIYIYVPEHQPGKSGIQDLGQLLKTGVDLMKPAVNVYMDKMAERGIIKSTYSLSEAYPPQCEPLNSARQMGNDVFREWQKYKLSL